GNDTTASVDSAIHGVKDLSLCNNENVTGGMPAASKARRSGCSSPHVPLRIDFMSTVVMGDADFYIESEYMQVTISSDDEEIDALTEQRLISLEESTLVISPASSQTGMSISNSLATEEPPVSLDIPAIDVDVDVDIDIDNIKSDQEPLEEACVDALNGDSLRADESASEEVLVAGIVDGGPQQVSQKAASLSATETVSVEADDLVLLGGHIGDARPEPLASGEASGSKQTARPEMPRLEPATDLDRRGAAFGSDAASSKCGLEEATKKRRIAPTLVSDTVPSVAEGNIANDAWTLELPVPALPADEARVRLRQMLRCKETGQIQMHSRILRRRLKPRSEFSTSSTLSLSDSQGPIAGPLDTFWFFRPAWNRFNAANVRRVDQQAIAAQDIKAPAPLIKLWCDMDYARRWQRRYISVVDAALLADQVETSDADDPILPAYGDSESGGEYPVALQREIDREQKNVEQLKAKAAKKERQRVALVETTIRQMCARFEAEWSEQMLPKLRKSGFYL
ncbi:hypothetical protein LPJ56_005522, partial [Coemansia sp. RSA 2599]